MANPILTGSLDSSGHPVIKIQVYGLSPDFKKEFEAMIDTGFTGFLMMPLTESFELALTLYGTSSWTLADGSSQPKLLAFGAVVIDDVHTHGVIVLEPNANRPLLGMEFLRKNKRALMVASDGCALFDEEFLRHQIAEALAAAPVPPRNPDLPGKEPEAIPGNPPEKA
jgi:predicted aspartyl protease